MRKLILAPMALACMLGAAQAQQQQISTADQGRPGPAPWPVSWTGQTVLADLRVGGADVASGNPVPTSVASLPLPVGAATAANQASEIGAIGSPSDAAYAGTGTTSIIGAQKGIYSALIAATPAGANLIGKVGIDQTAHGTSDRVAADLYVGGGANTGANPIFAQITNSPLFSAYYAGGDEPNYGSTTTAYIAIDKRGRIRGTEVGSDDPIAGIVPIVIQSGTSAIGKSSQGNLYGAMAVNLSTTAAYLVLINATAIPASGASIAPTDVAPLAGVAGATAAVNYGAGPPNGYSAGIVALVTTSLTNYTPGGPAFMQIRAR